jgi:hypothetical protein
MSDTTLEQLRIRERELELEAIAVRSRTEEVRAMIEMIEHPKRPRGRPRNKEAAVIEMPDRVGGATYIPDPDTAA